MEGRKKHENVSPNESGRAELYYALDTLLLSSRKADLVPGWYDMTVDELIEASKKASAFAIEEMKRNVEKATVQEYKASKLDPADRTYDNYGLALKRARENDANSGHNEETARFFNNLIGLLIAYSGPKDKQISTLLPELAKENKKTLEMYQNRERRQLIKWHVFGIGGLYRVLAETKEKAIQKAQEIGLVTLSWAFPASENSDHPDKPNEKYIE